MVMTQKMVKQLCNLEIIYILDHCDDTKKKIIKQLLDVISKCNLEIVYILDHGDNTKNGKAVAT